MRLIKVLPHRYEDAFKRIKEATGVDDVNVVIDKFLGESPVDDAGVSC